MFSFVVSRNWLFHQLDVKNVFLNGSLLELVFMHQAPGLIDPTHLRHVCILKKSLYGLKQAPKPGTNDLSLLLSNWALFKAGQIYLYLFIIMGPQWPIFYSI